MANPDSPDNATAAGSMSAWEAAYQRFETPGEEIRKFQKRLSFLGAAAFPRDSQVVELFCGRGNGLHALAQLGFTNLEGVDISPTLLRRYVGQAKCHVADCRKLPFDDATKDVLIVQGGLHHLPTLPESLEETFTEMRRVLRKNGRMLIVEPWQTAFLTLAHSISEIPLVRRCSSKFDAFATMVELEGETYVRWLKQPELILTACHKYFMPMHESFAWGKWRFVGAPL